MGKGTARKRRQIREMKEELAYGASFTLQECEECGREESHAEWCMREDEDHA